MKKIFVGNLAWKTSEEDLRNLFETYGAVTSVKIVVDQYTGKSKGFGFVEFETSDGAQAAINALHDKPYHDRNLRVSLALDRPQEGRSSSREPREGGGRSEGGFRGGRNSSSRGNGGGERSYHSRG